MLRRRGYVPLRRTGFPEKEAAACGNAGTAAGLPKEFFETVFPGIQQWDCLWLSSDMGQRVPGNFPGDCLPRGKIIFYGEPI